MAGAPRARAELQRAWATLHPRLRPVVVAMLGAGSVLAVLGAAGDLAGVWPRFPFLTNLASSLTGALFGLPVALLVVQRLLQTQTEADDRAGARRLALRSAHSMRVAALQLSGVDVAGAVAELSRLLATCDTAIAEARRWADRALAAKARPRRLRASMYQRTYLHEVVTLHRTAEQTLTVYEATGIARESAAGALETIRTEAAFLRDHIRPALLRLGGPWLPDPQARALDHLDDSFPAGLAVAGARQARAVRQLLDALSAAQLAALLPESGTARENLPDPDLPLPLPPVERLEELRAGLGVLLTRLDEAQRVARIADGIHDAVDRLG